MQILCIDAKLEKVSESIIEKKRRYDIKQKCQMIKQAETREKKRQS